MALGGTTRSDFNSTDFLMHSTVQTFPHNGTKQGVNKYSVVQVLSEQGPSLLGLPRLQPSDRGTAVGTRDGAGDATICVMVGSLSAYRFILANSYNHSMKKKVLRPVVLIRGCHGLPGNICRCLQVSLLSQLGVGVVDTGPWIW